MEKLEKRRKAVRKNRVKVLAVVMALLLIWGMGSMPMNVGKAIADQTENASNEVVLEPAESDSAQPEMIPNDLGSPEDALNAPDAPVDKVSPETDVSEVEPDDKTIDGETDPEGLNAASASEEDASVVPLAAHEDANGVTVGDFLFDVRADGTATIKGLANGGASYHNLAIPDTVDYNGAVYRVVIIGKSAFAEKTLTGTLTIGSNVAIIEEGAFLNSVGFEGDLVIPDSVTTIEKSAFSSHRDDSANLGQLVLSKNLTAIAANSFTGRDFTGDLIIPDSVTSIGDNAFTYCGKLTGKLVLSKNITTIGTYAFYECSGLTGDLIIPDSVTDIGYCAFYLCGGFTGNLTLPDSVTTVGGYAFYKCTGLDGTLTLSENLSSVGAYAFGWLTSVTGTLSIPNSLTYISDYAFYYCPELTFLELPTTVTYIGVQAFAFCYKMAGTVIKTSSLTIGSYAFYETPVTVIDNPNALVEIDSIMYYVDGAGGATALYHVDRGLATGSLQLSQGFSHDSIDYKVVEIATGAFAGSPGLTGELVLPDSLKIIGANAFYDCTGFTEVAIPDSVETIGNNAFYGATGIEEMTHKKLANLSLSLPAIGSKNLDDLSYNGYEERGVVDSSDGQTGVKLGKAAKWLNDERTEAEIRIDYGKPVPSNAKMDIIFVLDYSNSMLYSDDTTKTTVGGVEYQYPRSLIMDDLVNDAVSQLTGANSSGYDIRVGLTAFGYDAQWNSSGVGDAGFSKNAGELTSCMKPLTEPTATNYSAGLADAIAMLNARQDTSRQAIVVFLSDGAPYPVECNGVAEADQLRSEGINVYPMGIYQGSDDALKAISFDQSTIYSAHDTQGFEADLGTLLHNAFTKMNDVVVDRLSEWFEIGSVNDIEVSAGTASLTGDTISWDIANEDCGNIYTLKMKVKVKNPYYNDEYKPTNTSLITNEIIPTAQPELYRGAFYKVTYDANGGVGAVPVDSKSPYTKNSEVKVLGKGLLTNQLQVFSGWKIKGDASGKIYQEGDTFTITQDTVLVAQWVDDYIIITAQDFRMHISEAQAHQAKTPSEQLNELLQRGVAQAHWASTGAPVSVDYAVVDVPGGQGRNIPAAVGVYDVTYYAGNGKYEVHTTIKATVYGDPFTVTYEPGEHGTFARQVYNNLDYGASTPAFAGTPTGEAGWRFSGWAPTVDPVVTGNMTYVAQWASNTIPVVPPTNPPVTPDQPTTPTTPTTPSMPPPAEVTRIVEKAENAFGQVDSIAESVIEGAETPLAQAHRDCWVHWYILLGIVISAAYGIAVLVRRRRFTSKLDSYVDLALDECKPSANGHVNRVPAYSRQGA